MKLIVEKPTNRAYPPVLDTLGDHVRKRRLDLGLTQREAAKVLQIDQGTVFAWERRRNAPSIGQMPKILEFLGYSPFPIPITLPEKIINYRKKHGLSRKVLAHLLGFDVTSIGAWESGRRKPFKKSFARLQKILK